MTEQVRAICFPPDDDGFVGHVRELLTATGEPDERLRATVEAMLRHTYPLAVVSSRHPFAGLDDRPTWYVYRDGSVSPMGADPPAKDH